MAPSAVAAELVSVSTDGLLCHWDVARLTEPSCVTQLHTPAGPGPVSPWGWGCPALCMVWAGIHPPRAMRRQSLHTEVGQRQGRRTR